MFEDQETDEDWVPADWCDFWGPVLAVVLPAAVGFFPVACFVGVGVVRLLRR